MHRPVSAHAGAQAKRIARQPRSRPAALQATDPITWEEDEVYDVLVAELGCLGAWGQQRGTLAAGLQQRGDAVGVRGGLALGIVLVVMDA